MADMRPSSLPSATPGPPTAEVLEAFAIQRHLSDINCPGHDPGSAVRAIAQDALFERCDFSDADMRGLNLSRSTFRDCKAQRPCFSSAALEGPRWIGGSVAFGDFTGVECIGAVFEKLDAANTRWADALMTGVRFIRCRMPGARMSGHRGLGPSFSHCRSEEHTSELQ